MVRATIKQIAIVITICWDIVSSHLISPPPTSTSTDGNLNWTMVDLIKFSNAQGRNRCTRQADLSNGLSRTATVCIPNGWISNCAKHDLTRNRFTFDVRMTTSATYTPPRGRYVGLTSKIKMGRARVSITFIHVVAAKICSKFQRYHIEYEFPCSLNDQQIFMSWYSIQWFSPDGFTNNISTWSTGRPHSRWASWLCPWSPLQGRQNAPTDVAPMIPLHIHWWWGLTASHLTDARTASRFMLFKQPGSYERSPVAAHAVIALKQIFLSVAGLTFIRSLAARFD